MEALIMWGFKSLPAVQVQSIMEYERKYNADSDSDDDGDARLYGECHPSEDNGSDREEEFEFLCETDDSQPLNFEGFSSVLQYGQDIQFNGVNYKLKPEHAEDIAIVDTALDTYLLEVLAERCVNILRRVCSRAQKSLAEVQISDVLRVIFSEAFFTILRGITSEAELPMPRELGWYLHHLCGVMASTGSVTDYFEMHSAADLNRFHYVKRQLGSLMFAANGTIQDTRRRIRKFEWACADAIRDVAYGSSEPILMAIDDHQMRGRAREVTHELFVMKKNAKAKKKYGMVLCLVCKYLA